MRIDIISDVVCPWCLVGRRHLGQALAARPGLEPEIRWHPFELNPEVPEAGLDRETYWREKFGDPARLAAMLSRLLEAGAGLDIAFDFEAIRVQPNTRRAHELMHIAALHGRADAAADALFRAFFEQGRDLSRLATLVAVAGEAGLEPRDTEAALRERRYELVVDTALAEVRRLGVSGVPTFVFDGRHALTGAQPPEVIGEVLDHLAAGEAGG